MSRRPAAAKQLSPGRRGRRGASRCPLESPRLPPTNDEHRPCRVRAPTERTQESRQNGHPVTTCFECGAAVPAVARLCPSRGEPTEAPKRSIERSWRPSSSLDLVDPTALADPDTLNGRGRSSTASTKPCPSRSWRPTGRSRSSPATPSWRCSERPRHTRTTRSGRLERPSRCGGGSRSCSGSRPAQGRHHTGEVVVGQARVGRSSASGDAVNVAARLEQAAAPARSSSQSAPQPRSVARSSSASLGRSRSGNVRGRGLPESVRELSPSRPRGATVGADIRASWRRARAPQSRLRRVVRNESPELVTIVGEAGVGKTRLARGHRILWTPPSPPPRRSRRPPPGIRPRDHRRALAEVLEQHLGGAHTQPERLLADVEDGEILGLTFGLDAPAEVHPLVARRRLEQPLLRLLEELSAEQAPVSWSRTSTGPRIHSSICWGESWTRCPVPCFP